MRYVLYHSSCYDGFGAAYAAWKKFGYNNTIYSRTKYLPVSYGFPPPDMPDATEVFIVDFSYKADILKDLAAKCPITVIDHHKTAKEELESLEGCKENIKLDFDMNRSGALMTWDWFHIEPAPLLIQHISDRDLWKFKMEGTAQIHKALVSYPMEFELWDDFNVESLKKEGVTCERLYSQLVQNIIKSAWMKEIAGHMVPVVNTSIAWSEVGYALIEKYPDSPFAASFTVFDNQTMWSLRSKSFDVSTVAKLFGGGGHKDAAGFKTQRF